MNVLHEQEMLIEALEERPTEAEQGAAAVGLPRAKTSTSSHGGASSRGGASRVNHAPAASSPAPSDESSADTDPIAAAPGVVSHDEGSATKEAGGDHDGFIGANGGASSLGHDAASNTPAHGPVLLDKDTGCQRYFPFSARTQTASVTLAVEVSASGHADTARIIDERPPREGFGSAASSCALKSLSFAPAIDRRGAPVRATSTLQLRFTRRAHSG